MSPCPWNSPVVMKHRCEQERTHTCSLQWRHNERDGVSIHQPHDHLLNRLFKAEIKESMKIPHHWPLCGEFTSDRASNAENVSIWWHHHATINHRCFRWWSDIERKSSHYVSQLCPGSIKCIYITSLQRVDIVNPPPVVPYGFVELSHHWVKL